jgi:hypothetical protein
VKNDKTRFLITNSGTEKHTLLFKIKSIRSLELKRIWNGHNVEVNGVSNMLLLLKSPWLRAAYNIGAMFGIFFQRTTLCCSTVRNVTAGLACGTVWGPVYKKCISKTMANILNIGNLHCDYTRARSSIPKPDHQPQAPHSKFSAQRRENKLDFYFFLRFTR